ncbi:MAG TPA: FtsW/RodA/SpoVE family cell cycle protein, partial [Patescibacteria group bacterium]|nr:FtsW/RodA/SpoVE family cell cycle protein [Patescibacteria group bacterium]
MFDDRDEFVVRKSNADYIDWSILLTTLMLTTMGLISIYSATYDVGLNLYFNKQLIFAGVGLVAMIALIFVPERILFGSAYMVYGFNILLLIAVLIPGIGKEVYGQRNWIVIGPISFQPSELAKFGTLLATARYISQKHVNLRRIRDLGIVLLLSIVPMGLIMLEPDTGTATVFGAMLLGVLLWAGADLLMLFTVIAIPFIAISTLFGQTIFYITLGLFSAAALAFRRNIILTSIIIGLFVASGFSMSFVYNKMAPHQQNRVQTFINPDIDPRGKGYHVIQSKMAIGSGGIFGKGFLQGTQTQMRYIPKQWTDFIFCVPTEEFGFIGGTLVIGLLSVLIARSVRTAGYLRSQFGSIMCAGIAAGFLFHMLVNIGMALGVFP